MQRQPFFIAAVSLIAILLMVLYGIAVLTPVRTATLNDQQPQTAVAPLTKPNVDFGNPMYGPMDAPVTIVEFGDFQCPPCADLDNSLVQLLNDYQGKIRFVWKDMPNSASHPESVNAAIAARCAAEQGMFWQYHDLLLARQSSLIDTNYVPFAAELGLNIDSFQSCINDKHVGPLIQRDQDEAARLQIDSTPTLFINDRRVVGAVTYDQLKGFVDAELAKQAQAGNAGAAAAPAQDGTGDTGSTEVGPQPLPAPAPSTSGQ